jgi:hypothetical protein
MNINFQNFAEGVLGNYRYINNSIPKYCLGFYNAFVLKIF